MSERVRTILGENAGTMRLGDLYATSDQFSGGTHLPDVTVVTPV